MPYELRKVERALKQYGVELEKPKRGSHWRARCRGRAFTLPAHRRTKQIYNHYVRSMCRFFDIDAEEFIRKL